MSNTYQVRIFTHEQNKNQPRKVQVNLSALKVAQFLNECREQYGEFDAIVSPEKHDDPVAILAAL